MRNVQRREFMRLAGAAGAVLPFAWNGKADEVAASRAAKAQRPNVLIITTDQQQNAAMSAAGNPWLKTPQMDSIAAKGVLFSNSYCTYPLCSPSRASLHTSRMPHELGVDRNGLPIDPAIPVSGQVFRAAGYETGYAGKWHLPEPYPQAGVAGFEVLNRGTRKDKLAHDVDEVTADAAVAFLKRARSAPFLLVASFINPHDICLLAGEEKNRADGKASLAEEVWGRYQPPEGAALPPLPANFAPTAGNPLPTAAGKHAEWDEAHWRRYCYAYYRLLEDVDRQVGRVLAALREAGQEENTLVVFTSDHGEGLGAHHWTGKMMYFDEEANVPLIVSWKGVTPAGRHDRQHLTSTLDVLPTICDYAGVAGPADMRGTSLRAVIENPQLTGHEFVVSEMADAGSGDKARSFMVRTPRYKYMRFSEGKRQELLLDEAGDPGEKRNLAGEADAAQELERHRNLLDQWNTLTGLDEHPVRGKSKAQKKAARRR